MLSRLTHAPIDVVGTFWFDATPQGTASVDYSQSLMDEVHQALGQANGDPDPACGEVRVHVGFGPAKHALHETASRVGAGLMVVGTPHRGALGRIALGSTTDRVLSGAPCPIAVAPRGFRDEVVTPERIGVAFVDTPGGWAALRAGAAIARHTGAGLIAYTVTKRDIREAGRDRAKVAVERAIAAHARDIHSEARVLTSGGTHALVSESQTLDFLVRGFRGHGPMHRPTAFGPPSNLARRVACPFVVVPAAVDQPLMALFGARPGVTGNASPTRP
jgi:nucleotide-binding universal stress UspA family protein